jgi:hypothetical protein
MLKRCLFLFALFSMSLFLTTPNWAQDAPDSLLIKPKPRISIFVPLYLDSAYEGGTYRHGSAIPRHIISGLEFYNGVKIAADELQKEGVASRITLYDTKAENFFNKYFRDTAFEGLGIVIAAPQTAAELKMISDRLRPLKVPLISILPNDAGITEYPEMMIPNATLRVHCLQLHQFLQSRHSIDNIIMLTPQGSAEFRLRQYLREANQKTRGTKLAWQDVDMTEFFTGDSLQNLLDTNRMNVIVAPSLNATQAQNIVRMAAGANAGLYRTAIFGMPTWEPVAFDKSEFKGVDVWYGTPFLTMAGNAWLTDQFKARYSEFTNSAPGDMAFRGYEITLRYVKTYAAYGAEFLKQINNPRFRLFNDFNFKPVDVRENGQVDYQENHKIYFVKKEDGIIKTVQAP